MLSSIVPEVTGISQHCQKGVTPINKAISSPRDGVDIIGNSPTLYRVESLDDCVQKWIWMMLKNGRTMGGLAEGSKRYLEPLIQRSSNWKGVP